MSDNRCTLCGQEGHRASHCPLNTDLPRARIWPFGDGYVSQLAPHYVKQDGRGQHNVGKADTSKYAPKNPKAGSPLPGHRAPKGSK